MIKTLIQQATLITMDPKLGDLQQGDLLIVGDRIEHIAPHIDAPDAQRIDARGMIVIPGLINAHMHTWQTGLRGVAGKWTVLEYFKKMHAGLATLFKPEDIEWKMQAQAELIPNCDTATRQCHDEASRIITVLDQSFDELTTSLFTILERHDNPFRSLRSRIYMRPLVTPTPIRNIAMNIRMSMSTR